MRCSIERQSGIALLQVVIIAAILMLLITQISQQSHQGIQRSQWLQDKIHAQLALRSASAELQWQLLVNNPQRSDANPITQKWNFHSEPFYLDDNTKVVMQDISALLNVSYFNQGRWLTMLTGVGVEQSKALKIIEQLQDWQDLDDNPVSLGSESQPGIRNHPVVDLHELRLLSLMDDDIFARIAPLLSLYPSGNFNPMQSPDALLIALLGESSSQPIIAERKTGNLDRLRFSQLSGFTQTDGVFFYPGNKIKLDIQVEYGAVTSSEQRVIEIERYATKGKRPIEVLQWQGH